MRPHAQRVHDEYVNTEVDSFGIQVNSS